MSDGHSWQSRDAIRLWRASRAAIGVKDSTPLNNNRGNNRRRGRGNNRQQGGQQLNRIDSRARGNAPQMLEKYRKLAHDAHLNGDRVTAEYYLQFADHYFRVIADTRVRQEEQRYRREEGGFDRPDSERDDQDDGSEFAADNDFPSYEQPRQSFRRDRDERGERNERQDRRRPYEREDRQAAPEVSEAAAPSAEPVDNPYEPPENPFVRPARPSSRGLRPRRDRQAAPSEDEAQEGEPAFDPSSLPPSISVRDDEDEKPAPRRRGRPRKKPAEEGDSEAVATVG